MSINIYGSQTTQSRIALSNSITEQVKLSTSIATGEAIVDATGRAIGASLQGDAQVLEEVITGIKQGASVLNVAYEGAKAYRDVLTTMKQTLAKAKSGIMNDDLIKTTLGPVYTKLRDELNRIADSINFNGQALFNGSSKNGTQVTEYRASNLESQSPNYDKAKITTANLVNSGTLAVITADFDKVGGATVTSPVLMSNDNSTIEFGVTNATWSYDASTNKTTITGVNLNYKNLSYTATKTATETVAGTTDVIIPGVTISIDGHIDVGQTNITGKINLVGSLAVANTPIFNNSVDHNNKAISLTQSTATAPTISAIPTTGGSITSTAIAGGNVTLTGFERTNILANGEQGFTELSFVTSRDLFANETTFTFPTLTLEKIVPTLVTDQFRGTVAPNGLTSLENERDANIDIALVGALEKLIVEKIGEISAQQIQMSNMISQLETNIKETFAAAHEIIMTDLPKAIEDITQKKAKTQLAISVIRDLNQIPSQLVALVQ